ncbi:type VI secretion system lipoprotein TssJ [Limnohabitans sp. Jir72]|uniref:type VI secretion system lipoprotein TssJ n=1 Tax=Limnohabitans sp. Jir72 TaxID=1977909 RepID=UPI000D356199|nr:type VI secretion system lipoprotein TssJ [Limnohabitans sp. Jir72]PUE28970.1 type VI secretion system-associated lipoprotein [Limnohabitans sp. Jir72]
MRHLKSVALRHLVWLFLSLGCGMAASQEAKEPTKLLLKIEAPAATNPDDSGRPSPIKVRLYELKDSNTFGEADYFGLNSMDKSILGADMLAKDEFILRPGETRTIERSSHNQTSALGILAGYRDLANSTWRVIHPLKEAPTAAWYRAMLPSNKLTMTIQLQPQGIVLIPAP